MADIYEGGVPAALAVGHVAEARRVAERLDSHAERLSTHHRLHGVAVRLEVEEIAADWEQIRALTARAEEAVAANFETPCLRNARSLLLCATAWEDEEEVERAAQLERRADELGMEGYDDVLNAARLRLELARGRLDRVEQLVAAFARGDGCSPSEQGPSPHGSTRCSRYATGSGSRARRRHTWRPEGSSRRSRPAPSVPCARTRS